mmetsp:Transcript_15667/g.23071  ORF Transcript_15667/g.23071 Transcript_15667/m.23071 type:complete len:346 (+) Transcript_15667:87-1124(+)
MPLTEILSSVKKKENGIKISLKRGSAKTLRPAKKENGVKISLKRGRKTNVKEIPRGLPYKSTIDGAARGRGQGRVYSTVLEENDDSTLDESSNMLQDLPSDTLLLLQSIQQSQQCIYVPLKRNGSRLVPAVLESQLYSKLDASDTGDSIATQELHDLAEENKIRRLVPVNCQDLVAWMETKHYISAVIDANEYGSSNETSASSSKENQMSSKVISWFLENLSKWTKQTISKEALKQEWSMKGGHGLDQGINVLIKRQVLLPYKTNTFLFWLPHWGTVLSSITEAQNKVLAHIKRSHYKELAVKKIESSHYTGGLSGSFVLHTLEAQGKIQVVTRPSGRFAKLPKV